MIARFHEYASREGWPYMLALLLLIGIAEPLADWIFMP